MYFLLILLYIFKNYVNNIIVMEILIKLILEETYKLDKKIKFEYYITYHALSILSQWLRIDS